MTFVLRARAECSARDVVAKVQRNGGTDAWFVRVNGVEVMERDGDLRMVVCVPALIGDGDYFSMFPWQKESLRVDMDIGGFGCSRSLLFTVRSGGQSYVSFDLGPVNVSADGVRVESGNRGRGPIFFVSSMAGSLRVSGGPHLDAPQNGSRAAEVCGVFDDDGEWVVRDPARSRRRARWLWR